MHRHHATWTPEALEPCALPPPAVTPSCLLTAAFLTDWKVQREDLSLPLGEVSCEPWGHQHTALLLYYRNLWAFWLPPSFTFPSSPRLLWGQAGGSSVVKVLVTLA